jgi:hypothetical protein
VRNKVVVSLAAAIFAIPLFAAFSAASWFSHNSSVKSTNVDILYKTNLGNGTTLNAGTYKLEIPLTSKSPELKFYQNGKLVASVRAQVKSEATQPSATEVEYTRKGGAEQITEILPSGLAKGFVISGSSATKSGA